MKAIALSLLCGMIVGALFKYFRFPIPAPTTIAGIMGILGIWLGASIVTKFMES
ncbi:XapX domain-containing protein [Cohnella cellulosilytica]|uniref:XapX domain-containing protein n=1 Tax=Cohnella cellulosilytica TaxID=986710 RepID=A0ABW2F859_9BACL